MSRLPLGGKVLSECEANEGRSLLFYTFKFFENETAPHHRALRGASPQGEATKWLTIFAEKMKFAEFFSGKGKPRNNAINIAFPSGGRC